MTLSEASWKEGGGKKTLTGLGDGLEGMEINRLVREELGSSGSYNRGRNPWG